MYICTHCVGNHHWFELGNANDGQCGICFSYTSVIDLCSLKESLKEVIAIYEYNDGGQLLVDVLKDDFSLFLHCNSTQTNQILSSLDVDDELLYHPIQLSSESEFGILGSSGIWEEFSSQIQFRSRYFPRFARQLFGRGLLGDRDAFDMSLMGKALGLSSIAIESGEVFYRARKCKIMNEFNDFKSISAPPKDKCVDQRVSASGIRALYVSNDSATAISELRPDYSQIVALGKFRLKKECFFVDLRFLQVPMPDGNLEPNAVITSRLLNGFKSMLERPVNSNNDKSDYLLTQYLSEMIGQFYEGIVWDSGRGEGANYCFFEPVLVGGEQHQGDTFTELFDLTGLSFKKIGRPIFPTD